MMDSYVYFILWDIIPYYVIYSVVQVTLVLAIGSCVFLTCSHHFEHFFTFKSSKMLQAYLTLSQPSSIISSWRSPSSFYNGNSKSSQKVKLKGKFILVSKNFLNQNKGSSKSSWKCTLWKNYLWISNYFCNKIITF